ncbi:MAG: hypothetical protein SFY80_07070 [Verrucomicrobiota bacterium]|nr:hypothetical protein [Verrucomicrobiota bacterium]
MEVVLAVGILAVAVLVVVGFFATFIGQSQSGIGASNVASVVSVVRSHLEAKDWSTVETLFNADHPRGQEVFVVQVRTLGERKAEGSRHKAEQAEGRRQKAEVPEAERNSGLQRSRNSSASLSTQSGESASASGELLAFGADDWRTFYKDAVQSTKRDTRVEGRVYRVELKRMTNTEATTASLPLQVSIYSLPTPNPGDTLAQYEAASGQPAPAVICFIQLRR